MIKIVYTSFDGNTPYWKSVEPTVRAWCGRMGAELVNLPKPVGYQPQWVLFDAFEDSLTREADKFAWIDCDILVQKDAPDIFEDLPDRFFFCQPDPVNRMHPRMRRNWEKFNMINPRPYLVTAIVMWSPRHVKEVVPWFHENMDRFIHKDGDQELITVAVQEIEQAISYFPPDYHKMYNVATKDTPFLHAAGGTKNRKLTDLKKMVTERNDRVEEDAREHE